MADASSRNLRWVKPSLLRPEWHLLSNNLTVATLRWENWGSPFGPALAESAEGKWTFIPSTREGHFFHRSFKYRRTSDPISLRRSDSGSEIARTIRKGIVSALVEFSDGRTFQCNPTRGFWHPFRDYEWELADLEGRRLVRISRSLANNSTGTLEVEESVELMPERGLLMLLALFLVVWRFSGYERP